MTGPDDRLSPHFRRSEFRCKHCGRVVVAQELVTVLERIRHRAGRPVPIVSGYRCPVHNAAVGGAPKSQHLLGRAADIPPGIVTLEEAARCGASGVGTRGRWAIHVDVRPGPLVTWRY